MKLVYVEARDLPDSWFQCVEKILRHGYKYKIDRGSYEGQERLEFDYITVRIKFPGTRPLLPDIPAALGIPNPVEDGYLEQYFPYIMTDVKEPGEEYCYTEDTKILSENGWKYFYELSDEEKVATLSPFGELEYQKPIGYNKFNYEGDIYELNNRIINFRVNKGHKILCSPGNSYRESQQGELELFPVEHVMDFKYLKFHRTSKWKGVSTNVFVLPSISYENPRYKGYGEELELDMKNWLGFLGFWLADGSVRNQGKHYSVVITQKKKRTRNWIINKIKSLGFHPVEYDKDIIINNKQLYNYMKQFGTSRNKYIPKRVKALSCEYLEKLYEGLMLGDGDKNGYRYTTVSKQLCSDFSEIAIKLGKAVKINFELPNSKSGYVGKGCYRINISNKYTSPVIENNIRISKYKGEMYCVEVPNYNVILVSRNGTPHWSGNTYGERLVAQIDEVIKMYKRQGFGTNQACMSVSRPEDIDLADPPCLRSIDTRIKDGKLHFIVYHRSWDLWNGYPANLGGYQLLKEYMAEEIGVLDGEIIAASKGMHLYDYIWELAKLRCGK